LQSIEHRLELCPRLSHRRAPLRGLLPKFGDTDYYKGLAAKATKARKAKAKHEKKT
jgi:hypothetical protein